MFGMLILILRVGFLQIVLSSSYKTASLGNSEQSYPQFPRRGEVLDRYGNELIKNEGDKCITLTLGFIKNDQREIVIKRLASLLNMKVEEIMQKIEKKLKRDKNINTPVVIKSSVDIKIIIKIRENNALYPGVNDVVMSKRHYLWEENIAHILGYIGSISEAEYKRLKNNNQYRPISEIGKMGIENKYDLELRGEEGKIVKLVDAYLTPRYEIKDKYRPPVPGKKLMLTIDSKLQKLAYAALGKRRGAIIVSKPYSGEVLALVSSPSFNPNTFYATNVPVDANSNRRNYILSQNTNPAGSITPADRNEQNIMKPYSVLKEHPDKPLFNRVLAGFYPPGSTFKIIVVAAALNEGRIKPDTTFNCTGAYELGDRFFKCTKVHGKQNLADAVRNSCNYYFYRLGEHIG